MPTPSFFAKFKVLVLASVLAIGMAAGANEVRKAHASSPPTMTWGCFSGAVGSGNTTTAVVGTGATGQRIFVQYAELGATAAGIVALYEKGSTGTLTPIAIVDCTAAGMIPLDQNGYFGGTGYQTASGSSIVATCPSALTITCSIRYLAN